MVRTTKLFFFFCAAVCCLLPLFAAKAAEPAGPVQATVAANAPASIVVGFVGGFVHDNDVRHVPVQLTHRLQKEYPSGVWIKTFENHHFHDAYRAVLQRLDTNHDGILSDDEKKSARIILFGHSWGASTAVTLARALQRLHIPVMLTVQVDSVQKKGQDDAVIPNNVAEAVNFYQPYGLIHGRSKIVAADPSQTQILGNYLFDYHKEPAVCQETIWYVRLLSKTHMESECDPRLWSQVETLIRQHLPSDASTANNLGQ
jgi:pimeloyl-ACP methyl ester carboxylesterase